MEGCKFIMTIELFEYKNMLREKPINTCKVCGRYMRRYSCIYTFYGETLCKMCSAWYMDIVYNFNNFNNINKNKGDPKYEKTI
jgi:hypothetical protein